MDQSLQPRQVFADAPAQRAFGMAALMQGNAAAALPMLAELAGQTPADEELGIAAGEAAWAVNGPAAAIPYFSNVLARAPGRAMLRQRLGLALLNAGQPCAAATQLQLAVDANAGSASALTLLGMALDACGKVSAAVAALRRAAQLDPSDPAPAFHLGQALRGTALDDAVDAFTEAVRRAPDQGHLQVALGDALFAQRSFARALLVLRSAVLVQPGSAIAWARLGDAERMAGTLAAAASAYRRALDLQPGDPDLRALYGNALAAIGDKAGAVRELGGCMIARLHARRDGRLRVGVIAAPDAANTPTDFLIDRTVHDVAPIFMLDGFDYPLARMAEAYDVLFNAISDPDAAAGPLRLASTLAPQFRLPVLNHPWAVSVTTREQMARRLAGLPGIHMPQTRRVSRAALSLDDFAGPCLVRPAGQHGGAATKLALSASEMMDAGLQSPAPDLFLTDFVDFRSADGLYRKLRIVFVGDEPFPVHLAIGDHWLSHYFRMAMDRGQRDEEAAFLRHPQGLIGQDAWAALAKLPARAGLDFFGIDAAVGPDGRLIIFECNAAMLVRHADRPRALDYKQDAANNVRTAMTRLLSEASWRAGTGPHRPAPALAGG